MKPQKSYPRNRIQNLVDGLEEAIRQETEGSSQPGHRGRAAEILRFMKSRGLTIGTNNRVHDERGRFTGHKLND